MADKKVLNLAGFRILVIHGHQIVPWNDDGQFLQLQREHDVDIIITGHTKESSYRRVRGLHILNPGSAASFVNFRGDQVQPSFALLKLNSDKTGFAYIYKCSAEEGKKVDIQKYDLAANIEHIDADKLIGMEPEEIKIENNVEVKEIEVYEDKAPVVQQIVQAYDDEGSDEEF